MVKFCDRTMYFSQDHHRYESFQNQLLFWVNTYITITLISIEPSIVNCEIDPQIDVPRPSI
jgi:hypothetical protein